MDFYFRGQLRRAFSVATRQWESRGSYPRGYDGGDQLADKRRQLHRV